jgi:hypothetical protein
VGLSFPLLEERQGDREFNDPLSSWHFRQLSIPEEGGRIRLQITIPFSDLLVSRIVLGTRAPILSLAVTWQRTGHLLPSPELLAKEIIHRLNVGRFKPADRKGRIRQRLAKLPIKFARWSGDIYLQWTDRDIAEVLPPRDAVLAIRSAVRWTHWILGGFCEGKKLRGASWQARIYTAHRKTALMVANEIADLYLSNSPRLFSRERLDEIYPVLVQNIKEAYGSRNPQTAPHVTAHRLALALVDLKYGRTLPKLLDKNRQTGLTDSRLWARLLPKQHRNLLRKLCPADSVRDLIDWPETKRESNIAADEFASWWGMLTDSPNVPLRRSKKPGSIAFHDLPGVEEWATRVWNALYS